MEEKDGRSLYLNGDGKEILALLKRNYSKQLNRSQPTLCSPERTEPNSIKE
ncbi:hypothetical protein KIN20_033811 [Parelaphostrongylus tenuis]|uniref:Uncharacterized protein n=1 Tax=Parelaphostrongylus tenuis TaxID=148309 RepID=A0AAD5R8N6_PARTN|nr:hypothetical protein KIN20_033811 [Parelaphostrongylus tenuis]